jgi:hypothetical protein
MEIIPSVEASSRTSRSLSQDSDQQDLSKQFYGIEKKKDHSLMNVLPSDDLIPEAMPLIRKISMLNSREPDIYQRLKRGLTR